MFKCATISLSISGTLGFLGAHPSIERSSLNQGANMTSLRNHKRRALLCLALLCLAWLVIGTGGQSRAADVYVLCPRWEAQDKENHTVNSKDRQHADQFKIHTASVSDGHILVDTKPFTTPATDTWLWILTLDGKILTAPEVKEKKESGKPTFSHSSFQQDIVLATGEWVVDQGVLKSINNDSSHAGECTLDMYHHDAKTPEKTPVKPPPYTETGFGRMVHKLCIEGIKSPFKVGPVRHYYVQGQYDSKQTPKPRYASLSARYTVDNDFKCVEKFTDRAVIEETPRGSEDSQHPAKYQP